MPRMIDHIRKSAVSANLVQAAARGALSLPPEEMIEIMVYLANHNRAFGDLARMTLAGWDEKSSLATAANPATPPEVLAYLIDPNNLRPPLLPALVENPSVSEETLLELAVRGSREIVQVMLASARVNNSPTLRRALASNPSLKANETASLTEATSPGDAAEPAQVRDEVLAEDAGPEAPAGPEEMLDETVTAFMKEHAAEIAAEDGKPFQPLGGVLSELEPGGPSAQPPAGAKAPAKGAPSAYHAHQVEEEKRRGGALQKIAKLDIKGRIQLAMKGNKEERSILIRDGTKIVALAVLDSPKITDGEVEAFASQKNVLEAVLRGIPMKRRFAKLYPVTRNLVFNPRTPLDLSLSLMKHILVNDLRNLAGNKEISDTVRKLALKMFKQKMESGPKNN